MRRPCCWLRSRCMHRDCQAGERHARRRLQCSHPLHRDLQRIAVPACDPNGSNHQRQCDAYAGKAATGVASDGTAMSQGRPLHRTFSRAACKFGKWTPVRWRCVGGWGPHKAMVSSPSSLPSVQEKSAGLRVCWGVPAVCIHRCSRLCPALGALSWGSSAARRARSRSRARSRALSAAVGP